MNISLYNGVSAYTYHACMHIKRKGYQLSSEKRTTREHVSRGETAKGKRAGAAQHVTKHYAAELKRVP